MSNDEILEKEILEQKATEQETVKETVINDIPQEPTMTENQLALVEKSKEMLAGLSESDKTEILKLTKQLDGVDEMAIKDFGLPVQQTLGVQSEAILNKTKITESGEAGETLNELMYVLDNGDIDDKVSKIPVLGKIGFVKKALIKSNKAKYDLASNFETVEGRVDGIVANLNAHDLKLNKEIQLTDELIENNKQIAKAADLYIKAGELKAEDLKMVTIPELAELYDKEPTMDNQQALTETTDYLHRLEKRTMDLRLTQQILNQTTPQLTLMKNASYTLSEKIQSSINNAIPTWKNQVAIGKILQSQKDAVEADTMVTDTTNKLVRKNADMLGDVMTGVAKANERGIVEIDTLQYAQDKLLETVRETIAIQKQGRIDRENAKVQLETMEQDMKDKLLEIAQESGYEYGNVTGANRKEVYETGKQEATKKIDYKDMI